MQLRWSANAKESGFVTSARRSLVYRLVCTSGVRSSLEAEVQGSLQPLTLSRAVIAGEGLSAVSPLLHRSITSSVRSSAAFPHCDLEGYLCLLRATQ